MSNINFLAYSISACEEIAVLRTVLFIKELLKIVTFTIPIILILMISLDFAKNIIANKDDDMRKNVQLVLKRLIYAVALFLVPTIVNFAIESLGNFDTEYKECLNVTKESIEAQKIENEAKCTGDDYTWDETTFQCLIKPTIPEFNNDESKTKSINSNNSTNNKGNLVYYNQGDYKHVAFCHSGKTISSSGCGATSLSIIASSFSNKKYNPKNVAKWLCNNGHTTGALPTTFFTKKKVLEHFDLSTTTLFLKSSAVYQGNAGKKYNSKEGNKILNAVKEGKGIILYIPGHYVAVGPNSKCSQNEVYLYDVGRRSNNGCYTPKNLFNKTYNYKDRCSNNGNCGWKAAWAYTGK